MRNISVALGNADFNGEIIAVLQQRLVEATELVATHINWALDQQRLKKPENKKTQRLIKAIEKGLPRDA